jgi:deoxyribonuclease V
MKIRNLHGWQLGIGEAKELQAALASQVSPEGPFGRPSLIAGVDVSGEDSNGFARAAVVVLRYPELEVVEQNVVALPVEFPYVPGLLSFREVPLILSACGGLDVAPDLFIADGQGIAHPRRLGLASHLGLFLDIPTIGCAKSILCGCHEGLGEEPGDCVPLCDGSEVIGAVLRTKRGVKPVYVSVGHRVALDTAVDWTLACCRGYRLPEPTRLAHLAAAGKFPARAGVT